MRQSKLQTCLLLSILCVGLSAIYLPVPSGTPSTGLQKNVPEKNSPVTTASQPDRPLAPAAESRSEYPQYKDKDKLPTASRKPETRLAEQPPPEQPQELQRTRQETLPSTEEHQTASNLSKITDPQPSITDRTSTEKAPIELPVIALPVIEDTAQPENTDSTGGQKTADQYDHSIEEEEDKQATFIESIAEAIAGAEDDAAVSADNAKDTALTIEIEPTRDTAPTQTEVATQVAPSFSESRKADVQVSTLTTPVTPTPQPKTPQKTPVTGGEKIVKVRSGDTLSKILMKAGAEEKETKAALAALAEVFDPRRLQTGQKIEMAFKAKTAEALRPSLHKVAIQEGVFRSIEVERNGDSFIANESQNDIRHGEQRLSGVILNSLSQAAYREKVPTNILNEMIDAYSYDIDFQRDIRKKDSFEVMYEESYAGKQSVPGTAKLIYAALNLSGKRLQVYRFHPRNGREGFYNERGEGVRKALLRTPVNSARLSSRYGMRKHPILGYNKMHRGVDFAASKGTPIYAAGHGTVRKAGRNGNYGHYVEIEHNSEFSTAYAHLSRYAKGVKTGSYVRQGQIIGYVGSSGRSTGPHLHFEVHRNGKRINPLSVKLPSAYKLTGDDLQRFKKTVTDVKRRYAELEKETDIASRQ